MVKALTVLTEGLRSDPSTRDKGTLEPERRDTLASLTETARSRFSEKETLTQKNSVERIEEGMLAYLKSM